MAKVATAQSSEEASLLIEDREKMLANESAQFSNDLRFVMGSSQGRRFISHLIGITGVNRLSFTGNSETFFNEGQRNIGLMLDALSQKHCPKSYLQMLSERLDRNKKIEE
jgi:hypothetical protein